MSNAIRKIRRNQSEMAIGIRCNRYRKHRNGNSFKDAKDRIKAFLNKLTSNSNPMKHSSFAKRVIRELRIDREL